MPWRLLSFVLILGDVILFGVMALALIDIYQIRQRTLFISCCLLLAPFHTGFSSRNITVLLIPIAVVCWWLFVNDWLLSCGVLLGIGLCIKPQIFLAVALAIVVQKEFKPIYVAWCVGLTSLVTFLLVAPAESWVAFNARLNMMAVHDPNDFSLANVARYELLNFQVLPATFGVPRLSCNLIAVSLALLLLVIWLRSGRGIGPILVISLIPFYHRFYEAGVLVFVLAFAFAQHSKLLAGLCAPFIAPIPTMLLMLFPVKNMFWNAVVLSHEVWLLPLIALTAMAIQNKTVTHLATSTESIPVQIHSSSVIAGSSR